MSVVGRWLLRVKSGPMILPPKISALRWRTGRYAVRKSRDKKPRASATAPFARNPVPACVLM
jgi:hypothetical protein